MANYYNEFDPFAAAWLRNLIAASLIPDGEIDDRSITEVQPEDLRGFDQCHFFAGIAGWPLALELAGWDGPVWTGSCPCQPFSAAGKQSGGDDERHLWPVWFRLIRECRPDAILGEQVEGAIGFGWLDRVFADLEDEGYATGAAVLGAHSVGAPHIRQRLYWVADSQGAEQQRPEHQTGRIERYSTTDRLADASDTQRRTVGIARQDGRNGTDAGREETHGKPRTRGEVCGMADSHGRQSGNGHLQPGGQYRQQPQDGGSDGGLGNTNDTGPQGRIIGGDSPDQRTPWQASVAIQCGDGKIRRVPANEAGEVEPALFPLADGIPNRVGTLRGAGNAICPQTAAEFIKAYMET